MMDFKEVIWIVVISYCFAYVVSNETVHLAPRCKATLSKTNLINSGEISEANGYKVLHDFNFPDVTYPTTTLESCQPFYFNSNGIDAIVGPFSSDVQSNYRSLLSTNENKIKEKKKSIDDDNIKYQTPFSNVTIDKTKNESDNLNILDSVRKLFEKYIAINDIDSELKEILSILFGDNGNQGKSSEIVMEEPLQLLDEITVSNLTKNKSSEENVTESIEQLFDRFSEPKYVMNSVIEELIQLLDKNLADNNLLTYNSVQDNVTEIIVNELVNDNSSSSDNYITMQILSDGDISYNASSENIQLELELTKEDIEYIILNSTNDVSNFSKDIEYSMDAYNSISQNIEIEHINSTDDTLVISELILLPETPLNNQNLSNTDLSEHLAQPESNQDQLNNSQSVNAYKYADDMIDLTNFTTDENSVDSINTDQISFNIPKEPVVFDVIYRDAYNLEKPVLDIVPSSIPVRLKINIEIIKQDSNEIDDFYKPDFNIEQFAPRISKNHMGLQNNVKHCVENTEEDSAPEEQITVLDEINESDFINALSILLLDSLNNNPLEIIPPEFINDENCSCSSLLAEDSSHFGNNSLNSNITLTNYIIEKEEIQPTLAPESVLDNNMEHGSLETEMNQVIYNTSPIIEMLRSVITSDQLEDVKKYNNTDFKSKNNENLALDPINNIILGLEIKNSTSESQAISLNKGCNFENLEKSKITNTLLYNNSDADKMWPLVDVFQLKICPTEVDLNDKDKYSVN